jgi:hypothetical protein
MECRLNGNATPIMTFSGNTRNTANTWLDQIRLQGGQTLYQAWWSDIIIFDTNGSAPNDFLGNKRVYTLAPNSDSVLGGGNQFSTQPSQSAGSHYLNINEEPPNDDTSYNYDSTVGHRESYGVPDLPAGATGVTGINIWGRARIDDATPHSFRLASRSVAADAFSANINLAASHTYYSFFQAVDPNTSAAWLAADVGTSEIGFDLSV